jgi:hypothetical protein
MILIKMVVTNTCETWTSSVQDINNLLVFARHALRKTFGSVQCNKGCRIGNNNELHKLIEGKDIVKYIKAQRINPHRVVVSGGGGGGGE